MTYKQPKTTRKIGVSNCKFTIQNRKLGLTSLSINNVYSTLHQMAKLMRLFMS